MFFFRVRDDHLGRGSEGPARFKALSLENIRPQIVSIKRLKEWGRGEKVIYCKINFHGARVEFWGVITGVYFLLISLLLTTESEFYVHSYCNKTCAYLIKLHVPNIIFHAGLAI